MARKGRSAFGAPGKPPFITVLGESVTHTPPRQAFVTYCASLHTLNVTDPAPRPADGTGKNTLAGSNAAPQLLPEAGAQRTL